MKSHHLSMSKTALLFVLGLGFLSLLFAETRDEEALLGQAQRIFKPLPKDMSTPEFPTTPERVKLGQALFFDPRLSSDGTVSCARCHLASLYGTDALPRSIGAESRLNPHNAPTVLNAALEFAEHWYGDRSSVEDQAAKSFVGRASFGNADFTSVSAKIKGILPYQDMFAKAFPEEKEPITQENCGKAIGSYERTLVTPSPFDAYLEGDTKALSPEVKTGLTEFISTGCASCHHGVGVGGGMFRKFGVTEDYGKATGSKEPDKGRYTVTNNPADMYVFKVPSLRNVAMTPPYFHDGSVAGLPDAVQIMAKVQMGTDLLNQVQDIVHFLESLTGALPSNFAAAPALPAAGFQRK